MGRGGQSIPARALPKLSSIKTTWEKGLYEDLPDSMVPGGYATSLQNWEPNDAGGLRARVVWTVSYNREGGHQWRQPNGLPRQSIFGVTRKTRALTLAPLLGDVNKHYYVAGIINESSSYSGSGPPVNEIWVLDTGLPSMSAGGIYGEESPPGTGGAGWFPIWGWAPGLNVVAGLNGSFDKVPPAFARFNNRLFFTHPDANGIIRWKGNVPTIATDIDQMSSTSASWVAAGGDDTIGGRCIGVFKSRLFVAGQDPVSGRPYRLFYCKLGDELGWPANNFIDVGKEDEWAVEDMAIFSESLVLGKISGIHILTGGGPSTFDLQTIKGMQACQGRSLVSTPYGMCILGDSDIWMWSGGTPESIRDGVRTDYIAGSNSWRTAAYCDGKIVISQHRLPSKLLIYDPVAKRWWTEDVNYPQGVGAVASWNQRLMVGPYSEGDYPNISWLGARDWPIDPRIPDGIQNATPQVFQARSALVSPAPHQIISIRQFYLRVRQRGVGGPGLRVSLVVDGAVVHTATIPPAATEGPIWERLDLHADGHSVAIQFDQSCLGGQATYDIEDIMPTFDAMPLR